MSNEIVLKRVSTTSEFESLKGQWDTLFSNSASQSAFLSWEWLFAWWKVNREGKILWLITAWNNDKLIGIAPLMLETRNSILKVLTNLGTPQSDQGGFIHYRSEGAVVEQLLNYIIQNKSHWHIVELNEFDKTWLDQHNVSQRFQRENLHTLEDINNHYFIQLDNDWETFSTKLTQKFRKNLRRALRLAEDMGSIDVKRYYGDQVSWDVFRTIIEINRFSNFPRLYNSQKEQALIKELASIQNHFDVYILSVNNEPIAYEYGFVVDGRFEDWRSGFDTRFPQQISIGKLLAMKVVQECISLNYSEIDFLRGDESYKLEWQPNKRTYGRIRIFNNNIPGYLSRIWLQNVKPHIKK